MSLAVSAPAKMPARWWIDRFHWGDGDVVEGGSTGKRYLITAVGTSHALGLEIGRNADSEEVILDFAPEPFRRIGHVHIPKPTTRGDIRRFKALARRIKQ